MDKVTGYVTGVNGNLVSASFSGSVRKNEVGYVLVGDDRLKGEVIRVNGDTASMQIYEMTNGIQVGDKVELSGELMSVELTGLDYNSVYYYAAYVKTSTGETFYGEQRSFTIGENPTGIISVKEAEEQDKSAGTRPIMTGWFTLDGRKLQNAPTRSGIYIHNGKKISLR